MFINIILYSNNCPKCKILKQKLAQKQVIYAECDNIETMQKKGFLSVPMLEVDGEVMDFNKAIRWVIA